MRPSVSVCMATYNGARYLQDQVSSILNQLNEDDELVIVDDCSTDNSIAILSGFQDSRIRIICHDANSGHVKTFEHAMQLARKDFIFLSDQDDIWVPDRLKLLIDRLHDSNDLLITSNFNLIHEVEHIFPCKVYPLHEKHSKKYLLNIIGIYLGRRAYYGCAMLFRRELLKYALPIPAWVECHDIWLALIANILGKNLHCEENTFVRRIHANNVTPKKSRSFTKKMLSRVIISLSIIVIIMRIVKWKVLN